MSIEFHDWENIRAELHDGDDAALAVERARMKAWAKAFHLAEERDWLEGRPEIAEVLDAHWARSVGRKRVGPGAAAELVAEDRTPSARRGGRGPVQSEKPA